MDFFDDPESTREEILAAAYRALCRHGYADLTIETIGEEFDKSVSLIYHHYDGKDELLLACLDFMLEQYRAETETGNPTDPRAELEALCDEGLLLDSSPDDREFIRSLVELRGQAPHNSAFREHFTRSDAFFRAHLIEIIEAGIEDGTFYDVDVDRTAEMIHTLASGVFFRYATADDDEWRPALRKELQAYLEARLYRSSEAV
jgi:AcrR family transcriptional regulator